MAHGAPQDLGTSRRLGRNFALLLAGNLSGQVLAFIGLAQLARILGPAGFGLWNLAQAWMLYLLRGGELGLEVVGIRAIARDPVNLRKHTWNVLITRMLLAVGLFSVMVVVALLGLLPRGSAMLVLLFSVAVFPTAIVVEWVFESQQSVGVVAVARLLKGLVFFALVVGLVSSASDIIASIHFYNVSLLIATVVGLVVAQKRFRLLPPSFDVRGAISLFKEGLPIGVSTLLSQYSLFVGTIVLGYAATDQELGYFTSAHKLIVFFWAYGIVTSNRIVLPQLSRLFTQSREGFLDFVLKYTRLLAIASMPVLIVAATAGKEIVVLLFGRQYEPASPVFQILSIALVVGVVRSALETALIASDRQHRQTVGMAGLAILSTMLTYVLFRMFGITGAAWAMASAETLYALYLVFAFEYVPFRVVAAKIWKPLGAGACVALGLVMINGGNQLMLVAAGLLVYVVILWSIAGLTRADLALVKSISGISDRSRPSLNVPGKRGL